MLRSRLLTFGILLGISVCAFAGEIDENPLPMVSEPAAQAISLSDWVVTHPSAISFDNGANLVRSELENAYASIAGQIDLFPPPTFSNELVSRKPSLLFEGSYLGQEYDIIVNLMIRPASLKGLMPLKTEMEIRLEF